MSEIYNQPAEDASLICCAECDLLQRLPELPPGASARCPRCDNELWRHREDSLNRTLALALAALVLYAVANSVPMIGLTVVGRDAFTTVFGGAEHLWDKGPAVVGILVLITACDRAGAADRIYARDRPGSAAQTTTAMGRNADTTSADHAHLEHDRSDDARGAGRRSRKLRTTRR